MVSQEVLLGWRPVRIDSFKLDPMTTVQLSFDRNRLSPNHTFAPSMTFSAAARPLGQLPSTRAITFKPVDSELDELDTLAKYARARKEFYVTLIRRTTEHF